MSNVTLTRRDEGNRIAKPDNFTLTEEGADLLIVRKWGKYEGIKSVAAGVLALVVMLWLGSSANLAQALASGSLSFRDGLGLILFLGIFLVLAAYFLGTGIYQLANSTTIRVNTAAVSTAHHPLPWRTRTFPAGDIKQ